MSKKKEHGNKGNQNALKDSADKFSASRINLPVPISLKEGCSKAAIKKGLSISAWCREAIEEKLTRGE